MDNIRLNELEGVKLRAGEHRLSETSLAARFDEQYPHFPEMRAQFRKRAHEILYNERPVEGETNRRLVGFELEFS